MNPAPSPSPVRSPLRRTLLVVAGMACVGLGVLGIALPGLPTTPFLLAAAWLFARSSPRLSAWLLRHRWLGPYLRAVRDDGSMPRRAKAVTLVVLWATLGGSLWLLHFHDALSALAAAGLLAAGVGVTWFVGFRLASTPELAAERTRDE